jgi:hypothetical protein
LHAIPWQRELTAPGAQSWTIGLTSSVIGLSAGLLAGATLGNGAAAMLGVVGVYLGWQTALAIAVVTAAVRLPMRLWVVWSSPRLLTATPVYVAVTTLWHIVLWRPLTEFRWWPGPLQTWSSCLGWIATLGAFGIVDRWLNRGEHPRQGEEPPEEWLWTL